MLDLSTLARVNQEAAEREHRQLVHNIHALEVALHIPQSQCAWMSWDELRQRHANLKAQSAHNLRVNPDGDWTENVYPAYLASKARTPSLFHVER